MNARTLVANLTLLFSSGFFQPAPCAGPASLPRVEKMVGQANRTDLLSGLSGPLLVGQLLDRPTLIRINAGESLVFSCPGGIAGQVIGPAEFVLGPSSGNRYLTDLRQGTIAVLLDPDRPLGSPEFAIRTEDGVVLAQGTFYAITKYKGQPFVKVKEGVIKVKPKPPIKRNFSAYKKIDLGKASRK